MKKLLTLILLLACGSALAQSNLIINGVGTATITFTAPTEYTNGDPLPPEDLDGFVIFYNDQSRFDAGTANLRPGCTANPASRTDPSCYPTALDLADGSTTSQSLTFQLSEDVTLYFAMTAYVRDGNAFGDWSTYSAEVSKSFVLQVDDARPPNAPTIESIDMTITCTTNQAQVTCSFTVQ